MPACSDLIKNNHVQKCNSTAAAAAGHYAPRPPRPSPRNFTFGRSVCGRCHVLTWHCPTTAAARNPDIRLTPRRRTHYTRPSRVTCLLFPHAVFTDSTRDQQDVPLPTRLLLRSRVTPVRRPNESKISFLAAKMKHRVIYYDYHTQKYETDAHWYGMPKKYCTLQNQRAAHADIHSCSWP